MSSRNLSDLRQDVRQLAEKHIELCKAAGIDLLKKCSVCDELKNVSLFSLKRGKPKTRCKSCDSLYSKNHYEKNKGRYKEIHKKYRVESKDKVKECTKKWLKENPEKSSQYSKKYRENNPEKHKKAVTNWAINNIEKKRACYRKWAANNIEAVVSKNTRRKAAELNAIPGWFSELDNFVFAEARMLAKIRQKAFGFKWEVDHIVPLVSKEVCGFHCANNFMVIPKSANMAKGNRRSPAWESGYGIQKSK